MTPEQKTAYLKDPSVCPYCQSPNIDGEGVQIEGSQAIQEVACNDCYNEWEDSYQLADVRSLRLAEEINP